MYFLIRTICFLLVIIKKYRPMMDEIVKVALGQCFLLSDNQPPTSDSQSEPPHTEDNADRYPA